jgi:photosystem II stability/assembly factor-like uncharacterized protein
MKTIRIFCIIILSFFFISSVNAQWQRTNGPYGGEIKCFAVSGTSIFAGTSVGLFSSKNNGSWQKINTDLQFTYIMSLAVNGTYIFAGTDKGLFISTNSGTDWLKSSFSPGGGITKLIKRSNNIYASTYSGMFLSSDNGKSWKEINKGVTNKRIISLTASNIGLFAGATTYDPNDFSKTPKSLIFLTTNSGASWRDVSRGLPVQQENYSIDVSAMETIGEYIFTGTNKGLYRTTANGWEMIADFGSSVISLLVKGSKIYAGTGSNGIFLSIDNGNSWKQVNNGLTNKDIRVMVTTGINIFVGTSGGIFSSSDDGNNWKHNDNGVTAIDVKQLESNESNIIATCYTDDIMLTKDNGMNWSKVTKGLGTTGISSPSLIIGRKMFGLINWQLALSTDNGRTWNKQNNYGLGIKWADNSWYNAQIDDIKAIGTDIFAGTNYGVFLSTDDGNSWTLVFSDKKFEALTVSESNLICGASDFGSDKNGVFHSGIFVSSDRGLTWTNRHSNILVKERKRTGINAFAVFDKYVFCGTSEGILFSSNNGLSWVDISGNLSNKEALALCTNNQYLFVATLNEGVWKLPLSELAQIK